MSTATEKKTTIVVPLFGVEIDTDRMGDQIFQAIPGSRLRSRMSAMKPGTDFKTGEKVVPLGQAESMAMFPETPGMQIHINPAKLSYVVTDPLRGNKSLCIKIKRWLDINGAYNAEKDIDGVPDLKGTLDEHRMKTLCREVFWLLRDGQCKLKKGPAPEMNDIEQLPGHFLQNPSNQLGYNQPIFEKDFGEWHAALSRIG